MALNIVHISKEIVKQKLMLTMASMINLKFFMAVKFCERIFFQISDLESL